MGQVRQGSHSYHVLTPADSCGRMLEIKTVTQVGVVRIWRHGRSITSGGESCSGARQHGDNTLYLATGPDELEITIADTRWENGERDVRALETSGPPQIDHLKMRLRLQVQKLDGDLKKLKIDLRQARVRLDTDNLWSNLYKADEEGHARGAGIDVLGLLNEYGASVGCRGMLLGDSSTTRNRLCAVFPRGAEQIPTIAFVATRVLPLLNMVFVPSSAVRMDADTFAPPKRPGDERRYRYVYVVQLSENAGRSRDPSLPPVYVGQTGKTRSDRFREHKIGYKKGRGDVHRHGIRLMPELYPCIDPILSVDSARQLEESWAEELQKRGHLVLGGH